jgi:hypothetical protein
MKQAKNIRTRKFMIVKKQSIWANTSIDAHVKAMGK